MSWISKSTIIDRLSKTAIDSIFNNEYGAIIVKGFLKDSQCKLIIDYLKSKKLIEKRLPDGRGIRLKETKKGLHFMGFVDGLTGVPVKDVGSYY